MATAIPERAAFDRGVRPVIELLLPEKARALLDFRPDPEIQARVQELAEKANEGEISDTERAEYEGYVRANKFIAILQRQARRVLGAEP